MIVYRATVVSSHSMPEFCTEISEMTMTNAFPNEFERLIVSMYLNAEDYIGYEDDEIEFDPGEWCGFSWAVIHRSIGKLWGKRMWEIQGQLFVALVAWIRSFGKTKEFPPLRITLLAFLQPVPSISFGNAMERLIRAGFIKKRYERGAYMYYPLPLMVWRISGAQAEMN
jgi:hypothetical protein